MVRKDSFEFQPFKPLVGHNIAVFGNKFFIIRGGVHLSMLFYVGFIDYKYKNGGILECEKINH